MFHTRPGSRAWCAGKKSDSEWLLVDLGVASEVSGIETQGRGEVEEWVTRFAVSYSTDAFRCVLLQKVGVKKWHFIPFQS